MGLLDVEYDPLSDLVKRTFYDEADDKVYYDNRQDCTEIVAENKILQNEHPGFRSNQELRRMAQIPVGVVYAWMQEGVNVFDANAWPEVAARLDSSEWRGLRTAPGAISKKPRRLHIV